MDNGAEQQENYYKYNRKIEDPSSLNKLFYERIMNQYKISYYMPDKFSFIEWLRILK